MRTQTDRRAHEADEKSPKNAWQQDFIMCGSFRICGPDSSVGIATGSGLDGPGIESRLGARFSAPVQTGPGAHPGSCTMGTGSSPGVSDWGVTLTPHPFQCGGQERVQLYLYSPYGPFGLYRASVPVQYSYTSTPPMDRTACTEPQCLYSTAIPLLPLWTVRPVRNLSACTRVHFTFTFSFTCPNVGIRRNVELYFNSLLTQYASLSVVTVLTTVPTSLSSSYHHNPRIFFQNANTRHQNILF